MGSKAIRVRNRRCLQKGKLGDLFSSWQSVWPAYQGYLNHRELESMVEEGGAVKLSAPLFDMSQVDDLPKGQQTGEKLLNSSCLSRIHQAD